jgi:hypothetical protein
MRVEKLAEVLIWGADVHVMYAAAIAWWIYCRLRSFDRIRAEGFAEFAVCPRYVTPDGFPLILAQILSGFRQDRLRCRP